MTPLHDPHPDPLDELLGLDVTPPFSPEAREKLIRRLADARLDQVLDLDEVTPPRGLSEQVLRSVRRSARGSSGGIQPAGGAARFPAKRLMWAVPLGAAAALAIWTLRGGWIASEPGDSREAIVAESASTSGSTFGADEEVSDELLASLSVLENLDFLTEELDPLEADALFLLSADDQVLLDLLDAEAEAEPAGEDD